MPDISTFYPGGSSSNPVNNSTDATTATNIDDQNSANNALV